MSGWVNNDWSRYRQRGELIEQTALRLGRERDALQAEVEALRGQVQRVRRLCDLHDTLRATHILNTLAAP